MKPIEKVFIANRGEICRRIAMTAKSSGISTAAIASYRDDRGGRRNRLDPYVSTRSDENEPWHRQGILEGLIDSYVVVPEETTALYLDGAKMIAFAKLTGSDAIHPGFGFLSENADFAKMVTDAGLTWIGPSPDSIEKMASKSTARELAKEAGVPCIDGLEGFSVPENAEDLGELGRFVDRVGYPIIIKAAYGGGGKGMRLVWERSELFDAATRAHSEAVNSFGNGTLICERYIEKPRHVEVQIFGDHHGNVVAIGDRDCSLQRRHQKIIEEAPAPGLSEAFREKMHAAAVSLARSVSYHSAGTVEFLLEADNPDPDHFFFLEMNTRLQVEHPVTEEVFGIDLVALQFDVAGGKDISIDLPPLQARGHSFEARIYAEDPDEGFFPAPGPVLGFVPYQGPGIRWEPGIDTVDMISGNFDPMIAKLVATGESREKALARLANALNSSLIAAPASNQEFLSYLCTSTEFATGPVSTRFIGDESEKIREAIGNQRSAYSESFSGLDERLRRGGSLVESQAAGAQHNAIDAVTHAAFHSGKGDVRPSQEQNPPLTITREMRTTMYGVARGREITIGQGMIHHPDGTTHSVHYSYGAFDDQRISTIQIDGRRYRHAAGQRKSWAADGDEGANHNDVHAPVPGRVIKISPACAQGAVSSGEPLFVLESMKMEFEVKADRDGSLKEVLVSEGDQVTNGQVLAKWST